ncbi:MBL fold metallo-hydrolase [Emticicia sp. W12TSBA100-4]|uniref:MBL fold metallo-hydrolase n=1 Tax=Emticicia sp. W12TSBA100-4 TaxID=3160965 RepID=UPI00330682D5
MIFLIFSKVVAQNPYVQVLGVAQDGGFPQANCQKECCKAVFEQKSVRKFVSCIAVVDPISKQNWLFDATPDFTQQLHLLNNPEPKNLGIFLTHAHIGHYTGLMYLGREAMGASQVKVYAMPKMKNFIEKNGPWSQLVALQNINIQLINEDSVIVLNERISVQAFRVPHRDEFSETVGYKIFTANKSLIFIPDIDKWQKWNRSLKEVIKSVDYAFLDGTFYKDGEINRPMSEVPHPFVTETMDLLKDLPTTEKAKVHFIHFNHTNPIMNIKSLENKEVRQKGFKVAFQGEKVEL